MNKEVWFPMLFSLHVLLYTVWNRASSVFKRMSSVGSRQSVLFIVNFHFATDHLHAVKMLVLLVFVDVPKFKSYFELILSYAKSLKLKKWSGHREILTPQRTSTNERPFTHKGNYLVVILV